MALQSSTINKILTAGDQNAEWHEAWRNVDDYLNALSVTETLRLRIHDQIFQRALEASPAEPVKFAMEQLFGNAHLQRILKSATHKVTTQPEVEFTSMLPEKMDFVPVVENTGLAARWIVAAAGILTVGTGIAFVVSRLINF